MLRVIMLLSMLMVPSLMTAGEHYVIQDSPDGPCLVKWLGKESIVDFNLSPELRSVKVIGEMAFEMNKHIRKVILPEGLTAIRKRAFNTCENLTSVEMPPSVREIGNSAFNMDRKLELKALPDSLVTIGEWAFWDCTKVSVSVIPESVRVIGRVAFTCCEGIRTFSGCKNLERIEFHDGLEEIGDFAFARCTKLTELHLPDTVEKIGYRSFANCFSLEKMDLLSFPTIDDTAFDNCDKLR